MAHPLLDQASSSSVESYRAYRIDEPVDQTSLFVEFKSGDIYRYVVPWNVYLDMKVASSLGQFVNKMKSTYKGVLIASGELIALINSASTDTVTIVRKKKAHGVAFFRQYPQFGYFF